MKGSVSAESTVVLLGGKHGKYLKFYLNSIKKQIYTILEDTLNSILNINIFMFSSKYFFKYLLEQFRIILKLY